MANSNPFKLGDYIRPKGARHDGGQITSMRRTDGAMKIKLVNGGDERMFLHLDANRFVLIWKNNQEILYILEKYEGPIGKVVSNESSDE